MPFDDTTAPSTNLLQTAVRSSLRTVRDAIEQGHWIKGTYHHYGDGEGHCLVGWLRVYTNNRPMIDLLASQLSKPLSKPREIRADVWNTAPPEQKLIYWNDIPKRRKQDVLRLFDKAIADC